MVYLIIDILNAKSPFLRHKYGT